jgi:hypothetical protein
LRFGEGTNGPAKIFERFEGSQSVGALTFDQYTELPQAGWLLRDRAVFHFDSNEVTAIVVHQQGSDCRFVRDGQNGWTMAPLSSGMAKLPATTNLNETLARVGRLRAVYWDGVGGENLDRFGFDETDYRLDFEIKRAGQMETNTIHFGKASPMLHPYASVVRGGRRLIFEAPVDLYDNWVKRYLCVPETVRPPR